MSSVSITILVRVLSCGQWSTCGCRIRNASVLERIWYLFLMGEIYCGTIEGFILEYCDSRFAPAFAHMGRQIANSFVKISLILLVNFHGCVCMERNWIGGPMAVFR